MTRPSETGLKQLGISQRECSDDRAGNINSRIFDHSHLSVVHGNSCVVTRAASEIQSNTRFCYILSRRNLNRVGATFWRRRSDRHGGIHTRPAAAQNTGQILGLIWVALMPIWLSSFLIRFPRFLTPAWYRRALKAGVPRHDPHLMGKFKALPKETQKQLILLRREHEAAPNETPGTETS